jgi:hypothetical protein
MRLRLSRPKRRPQGPAFPLQDAFQESVSRPDAAYKALTDLVANNLQAQGVRVFKKWAADSSTTFEIRHPVS